MAWPSLFVPAALALAGCGGTKGGTSPTDAGHPSPDATHDAAHPRDAGPPKDARSDADAGNPRPADAAREAAPLPTRDGSACLSAPGIDSGGFSASYTLATSASDEQDKAFYLLTLFENDADLLTALNADPVLAAVSQNHDTLLRSAQTTCGSDVACYTTALEYSAADIQTVAGELPTALGALLPTFAETEMRPSGVFALYAGSTDAATGTDADLLSASWSDTAASLNATYGGYAATLSASALENVVSGVIAANPNPMPFFAPLLQVDLAALIAQDRDEATEYDPLSTGENAAALAALPSVDWSAYPYTVILVPGQGPTTLTEPLDPTGQARCDLAALRFAAHYAPFVALSGGHVHPDRTPYCEALEMKSYMMNVKGIPESAILVDPYARHTSTNVRNVSRELFRYGIPVDRPALVTTDIFQSLTISEHPGSLDMEATSSLFYLPYRALVALSPNDTCLMPSPITLTGNGRDPLDP
jgi:hypothetical protein